MNDSFVSNVAGWRKRQIEKDVTVELDLNIYNNLRNEVLEEIAQDIENMKFGDTSQSFAIYIRNKKK